MIFAIYDSGEAIPVDSLEDIGTEGLFLVQVIEGDKVRWYDKKQLIKQLGEKND